MKPSDLMRPQPYEVWTGRGHERRKVETLSRDEAEREYQRLQAQAEAAPAIFLGSMLVKGDA